LSSARAWPASSRRGPWSTTSSALRSSSATSCRGVLEREPAAHDLAAIDDAFSELTSLADADNPGAGAVLDRAARLIAAVLVSIINLLDVDEVVFGGPAWARVAERFRTVIAPILNHSPDRVTRHPVRLSDASVGEDVAAVGAACLGLDGTLSPRPSALLISD
jgi:predicted NBD/HSP70 family sugar kinase